MTTPSVAQLFQETLEEIRSQAPAVGTAAMSGKSPNIHLRRAWKCLDQAGVKIVRSNMNYRWRALHASNPKLGHAIEEVLVFGDALFSAWGKKQSPVNLPQEYLDLKQRFAKIIKETQAVAAPPVEKKAFVFWDNKPADIKIDIRLDELDVLLEQAHEKSRNLLHKTEDDLVSERAFHRAAEWYVLALEKAKNTVEKMKGSNSTNPVAEDIIDDLHTALLTASATTSAILAQTDMLLRVKEELHNKSILFLTAHENTFTVIQGHLRSWKDIKLQTEALNGLSETVQSGMRLMSSASQGMEDPIKKWSPSFVTPETIQKLTQSFDVYDGEVSALVNTLTTKNEAAGVRFSRWDAWEDTKKNLLDPLLAAETASSNGIVARARPQLRAIVDLSAPSAPEDIIVPQIPEQITAPLAAWSLLDRVVVKKSVEAFNQKTKNAWTLAQTMNLGWSAQEAVSKIGSVLRNLTIPDEGLTPRQKSRLDYIVRHQDPTHTNWDQVLLDPIGPIVDPQSWRPRFEAWMKQRDDVDWSSLMQWNDLAMDLLILDQDVQQKEQVLQQATPESAQVRAELVSRLSDFIKDPGVSEDLCRQWGLCGLFTRYAIALDMGEEPVEQLWKMWDNPMQPVDWDGSYVAQWTSKYPTDLNTPTGEEVWDEHEAMFEQEPLPAGNASKSPVATSSRRAGAKR